MAKKHNTPDGKDPDDRGRADPADLVNLEGLSEEEQALAKDESHQKILETIKREDLAGGTVRLERRGPMDQTYAYVTKMNVEHFDMDQVKKQYGGGSYIAKFFRANGQMGARVTFEIDPRIKGQIDLDDRPTQQGSNMDPAKLAMAIGNMMRPDPSAGNATVAMMKQMSEASSRSTEMLMAMMSENSKNIMTMMTGLMTVMAQMGNRPATTGSGGIELKDILPLLLATQNKSGGSPSMVELITVVKELKGLTDANAAPGEDTRTVVDRLIDTAPALVAAFQGKSVQPAVTPPKPVASAQPKLPNMAGMNGAPVGAPTPAPIESKQDRLAGMQALLLNAAKKKSDVDLYVDLVLDSIEPDDEPIFMGILTSDTWLPSLFGTSPEAKQNEAWLTDLRNKIVTILSQPPQNEPATAGADGESTPADTSGVQSPSGVEEAGRN